MRRRWQLTQECNARIERATAHFRQRQLQLEAQGQDTNDLHSCSSCSVGGSICADQEANEQLYGEGAELGAILGGRVRPPPTFQPLYEELAAVLAGEPLEAPQGLDTPDDARVRQKRRTFWFIYVLEKQEATVAADSPPLYRGVCGHAGDLEAPQGLDTSNNTPRSRCLDLKSAMKARQTSRPGCARQVVPVELPIAAAGRNKRPTSHLLHVNRAPAPGVHPSGCTGS